VSLQIPPGSDFVFQVVLGTPSEWRVMDTRTKDIVATFAWVVDNTPVTGPPITEANKTAALVLAKADVVTRNRTVAGL